MAGWTSKKPSYMCWTRTLATTVATNAEATDGQLSLAEYPDVAPFAPAGNRVWWLQLDDPDSTSTDETSDLGMGFSTLLLDEERWELRWKAHALQVRGGAPPGRPHRRAALLRLRGAQGQRRSPGESRLGQLRARQRRRGVGPRRVQGAAVGLHQARHVPDVGTPPGRRRGA